MSNFTIPPKSPKRLLLSLIAGVTLLAVAAPAEAIVKVTKVTWLGNPAWKIEGSANGIFYFEAGDNGRTGFSSAIDLAGKDWILNDGSSMSGMVREYRGFPNLGDDNFNHPQRNSNSTTRWVGQTGTALGTTFQGESLVMESSNTMFAVEYHFFATHISIKMVRAGGPYSFLFEGPVGGVHQPGVDWIVGDSDPMPGTQRPVMNSPLGPGRPTNNDINTTAFPGRSFGKFFYMGDPVAEQVFFVAKTPDTMETDEGYGQASNMTIASFGRGLVGSTGRRQLTGTTNVCTFGFLTKSVGHAGLKTFIEGTLANPFQPAAGGGAGGASGTGTGGAAGGAGGGTGTGGRAAGGTTGATGGSGTAGVSGGTGGTTAGSGGSNAGSGGMGTTGTGGGPSSSSGGSSGTGGSVGTGGGSSSSGGTSGTGGALAGTGGTTPGGSGGGGPGTGGRTATDGGTSMPGDDAAGCGCAVAPRGSSLMSGFAVALLFGLMAARRRRRRR